MKNSFETIILRLKKYIISFVFPFIWRLPYTHPHCSLPILSFFPITFHSSLSRQRYPFRERNHSQSLLCCIECARGRKKMRESCADTGRLTESGVPKGLWKVTSIPIPFRYTGQGPAVIHPSTDPHWCLDASETYHTPNAVRYKQYISIQEAKTSVKIQHEPVVEGSYDDVNFNVSLSYWGIYAFMKQNRGITVKVLRIKKFWNTWICSTDVDFGFDHERHFVTREPFWA